MYHYTECGLDNVWLENGYRVRITPYGLGVSIEDAEVLHQLLASTLLERKDALTEKELCFLRVELPQPGAGPGGYPGETAGAQALAGHPRWPAAAPTASAADIPPLVFRYTSAPSGGTANPRHGSPWTARRDA